MKRLAALGRYFRREPLTAVMTVVVLAVIAASIASNLTLESSGRAPDREALAVEKAQTTQNIRLAGEKMVEEIQSNQPLVWKISLSFMLFISFGLLIDAFLFFGVREGRLGRIFPGPGPESPWSVGDVFKAFIFLFFAEILISVGLGFWAGHLKIDLERNTAFLLGGTMLRNVIAALYVLHLVSHRYGAGLRELGFRAGGVLKQFVLGLAVYTGFFPLYLGMLVFIMGALKLTGYEPPLQTVVEVVYEEKNAGVVLAASLVIAFLGPFFEEMFFRGFMFQAFRRKWGGVAAGVWVSVIFAAMHGHWVAFLPIFALSAVLCLLFHKTGSLAPGIALHVIHNFATLVIMLQVKGFQG